MLCFSMRLLDSKTGAWGWCNDADLSVIQYDDGTSKPLTTSDVVLDFGRNNGTILSEFSDVGYLRWMLDTKDFFQEVMVRRRLAELAQ